MWKLISLSAAVAITSNPRERVFSALKRIETAARSIMTECSLEGLLMVNVEEQIVAELEESRDFFERCVTLFAVQNNHVMDLFYK